MPAVSVIVPNYNHARYLENRVQSILNQTYGDLEVIILDDCSTDESRKVIKNFEDHPLVSHVVYNEVNSGSPFKQWNKGIALAKGEYIWIAESDDHCESLFLEKAVQKMREYPSAGIVFVQSVEIDELTGKEFLSFSDHPRFRDHFQKTYFNSGENEIRDRMVFENTIPNASGVLFRKNIYTSCGGVDESMRLCGDWMLWSKMLCVSDVVFIAEPLNYFRLTNHSVRNRYSWLNTVRERMKVLSFIEEKTASSQVAGKHQVACLRRAFKFFPLRDLQTAFRFVYQHTGEFHNKKLKITKAFLLSLKDRVKRSVDGNTGRGVIQADLKA